ncbi:two component transcriptional regulator, winged helix family [Rippkaea orientalis PCC 8801]|uniref:Two component transcriptional regulator, winged helix family n=2 Tax=Rippkaea TaxID=2546365 RepID=B7K5A2_RIPO1|nr:two component transcriptional regulator, winged helix family [Rippkaea orientalis PCC 8801]
MAMFTSAINPCIFLVELDDSFNERVKVDLDEAGYIPVIIPDAVQAFAEVKLRQPAMVVIDRNRSRKAGLTLCRQLRKADSHILIIMVLEEETVEERVVCLEAGADDYLLKPYHGPTLIKLIQFYLAPPQMVKEQLQFDDLVLDLSTRRLFLKEKAIDLTMKEFELLKYLMSHPKEVLTREKILENVWGYDFQGESNVIEVYIRYLRLKIESEGHKRLIHTVRGVGYVLREG